MSYISHNVHACTWVSRLWKIDKMVVCKPAQHSQSVCIAFHKARSLVWPDRLSCGALIACSISAHTIASYITSLLATATIDWNVLLLTEPSKVGLKCSLEKYFNAIIALYYAQATFCNSDLQCNFIQQTRINFS